MILARKTVKSITTNKSIPTFPWLASSIYQPKSMVQRVQARTVERAADTTAYEASLREFKEEIN
jgi:hypothetical protein